MHGEAAASSTFAQTIRDELGWSGVIQPRVGDMLDM